MERPASYVSNMEIALMLTRIFFGEEMPDMARDLVNIHKFTAGDFRGESYARGGSSVRVIRPARSGKGRPAWALRQEGRSSFSRHPGKRLQVKQAAARGRARADRRGAR